MHRQVARIIKLPRQKSFWNNLISPCVILSNLSWYGEVVASLFSVLFEGFVTNQMFCACDVSFCDARLEWRSANLMWSTSRFSQVAYWSLLDQLFSNQFKQYSIQKMIEVKSKNYSAVTSFNNLFYQCTFAHDRSFHLFHVLSSTIFFLIDCFDSTNI